MPQMTIIRNSRAEGKSTVKGDSMGTFTGDVYIDRVYSGEGITMANVNFTPCARTYWHYHEGGQMLRVIAGSGWVCDKGGEPCILNVGDIAWCPPGTTHWHGADDGSYMVHLAVAHGKVEWYSAVSDEEYSKKQ